MDQDTPPRITTGEYVTKWQTIVEDHLVGELGESLRRLAAAEPRESYPAPEQRSLLAYHMAHALRLAASSNGSVQSSVEYLQWAAAAHGRPTQRAAAAPRTADTPGVPRSP